MHLYQYLCFPLAIHISAHVFNFENLVQAYDGTSLQHALSIMEDVGNKTYINPVRNQNSVSVHNTLKWMLMDIATCTVIQKQILW